MSDDFKNFLKSKALSDGSVTQYLIYFKKMDLLHTRLGLTQDFINSFIATYKSNLVRSFIKLYFEYKNITDLVIPKKSGRTSRKKIKIISNEDMDLILKVLYNYNEKVALMVELSYCCALRRDEVCNIEVGDIDWIEYTKERKSGNLFIRKAKNDKQRNVIIPAHLMLKLASYVNKNIVVTSDKLFFKNADNKDKPISKQRYWEIFHEVVIALFGKKYKLHTLRHTKATEWYNQGIDIVRIQQRLGHSNISTTRLYINPDEKVELQKWRDEDKKP